MEICRARAVPGTAEKTVAAASQAARWPKTPQSVRVITGGRGVAQRANRLLVDGRAADSVLQQLPVEEYGARRLTLAQRVIPCGCNLIVRSLPTDSPAACGAGPVLAVTRQLASAEPTRTGSPMKLLGRSGTKP